MGKKVFVTDVKYNNSAFGSVDERMVKPKRPSQYARDKYIAMGHIIDSLGLQIIRRTLYIF